MPPMIPAMLNAPAVSHTSSVKSSSLRSTPSSVVNTSPGLAVRVMIVGLWPPARLRRMS